MSTNEQERGDLRGIRERGTIRDVARLAGVSTSTVSRALSGKGRLSKQRRIDVLNAATKLGYIPNGIARALVAGRTDSIGVLITDNSSPVYADLLSGIESVCNAAGLGVLFANTSDDADVSLQRIRTLIGRQVDGLLVTPVQGDLREIFALKSQTRPFVLLVRKFDDIETDYVVGDNECAGRQCAEHLIALGHEHIGYLAAEGRFSSVTGRFDGYLAALHTQGLPYRQELVVTGPRTLQGGFLGTLELLSRVPRPTALIAATMDQAFGALRAAQNLKLCVPDDLAIVGADEPEGIGRIIDFFETPLTTFRFPYAEIGERGARILLEKFEDPSAAVQQIEVLPQLQVRASTIGREGMRKAN